MDSVAALVRWLGMPAERFMIDDEVSDEAQPELLAEFAPLGGRGWAPGLEAVREAAGMKRPRTPDGLVVAPPR